MNANDPNSNQSGQATPPQLEQSSSLIRLSVSGKDPAVDKNINPEMETRLKIYKLQHGAGIRRLNNYRTRKALAILLNGKQESWEKHHDHRGRWTDARANIYPDWQLKGCVILLKYFEVTDDLHWRVKRGMADHFDGLWKKINREELGNITRRFGSAFIRESYRRRELALVFKMAERAGIIDRRKRNWIKFNPDKFLGWIEKAEAYRRLHYKTF